MITCVAQCTDDIVLLKEIIVISLSNPSLMLALISHLTLIFVHCLLSILDYLDDTLHNPLSECSIFLISGMAMTRSMVKRSKASWSDLSHDLLCVIMMQLGVIDFIAFSCVCKSWRSLALSNWYTFMRSRVPMSICVSTGAKKECYLEDREGRKFKTVLPHSSGRFCVGLTCGYLILWGIKTRDFWLVNPITRHEFHFPCFPIHEAIDPAKVKGILVFSPSKFCWMFVVSFTSSRRILFSFAGEGRWHQYDSGFNVHDLFAFKGKIYVINVGSRLCEMKLTPYTDMKLLEMNNFPMWHLLHSVFATSGENLYVVGSTPKVPYVILKVDFDKMEWVLMKNNTEEYALFLSELASGTAIKPETWADPGPVYGRAVYFIETDKSQQGRSKVKTWYFPHDCLNVNLPSGGMCD